MPQIYENFIKKKKRNHSESNPNQPRSITPWAQLESNEVVADESRYTCILTKLKYSVINEDIVNVRWGKQKIWKFYLIEQLAAAPLLKTKGKCVLLTGIKLLSLFMPLIIPTLFTTNSGAIMSS